MKQAFLLFFCLLTKTVLAQETSVAGIIFDTETKIRIARVNVVNLNTGESVYNNINGVFQINAKPGDQLVFAQLEHLSDTIKVQNYVPLAIYLKRVAIQLKEVTIFDTLLDPQKKLLATRKSFAKAYGPLANNDILALAPGVGVGLGIDALYNAFSRSGRNAKKLRETIESDYKQDVIDYRFNKTLVSRVTGLKGAPLADFMTRYRPGYYFLTNATEYEFINSIKTNYRRYLRSPKPRPLPALYPPKK